MNIQVLSLNAMAILSKGLRKDFTSEARELMPNIIEKFKDKKGKVLIATYSTMDSIFKYTLTIEDIIDHLRLILPSSDLKELKENICVLIERSLLKTNIPVLKKICKPIAEILSKTTEDKSGDVRDASLKSLGVLKARVGAKPISKCNFILSKFRFKRDKRYQEKETR